MYTITWQYHTQPPGDIHQIETFSGVHAGERAMTRYRELEADTAIAYAELCDGRNILEVFDR